eukprot:4019758-Pleurochrysis_carterae.AAC.1
MGVSVDVGMGVGVGAGVGRALGGVNRYARRSCGLAPDEVHVLPRRSVEQHRALRAKRERKHETRFERSGDAPTQPLRPATSVRLRICTPRGPAIAGCFHHARKHVKQTSTQTREHGSK